MSAFLPARKAAPVTGEAAPVPEGLRRLRGLLAERQSCPLGCIRPLLEGPAYDRTAVRCLNCGWTGSEHP